MARGLSFIEELPGGPLHLAVGGIEAGAVGRHAGIALAVRSAEPVLYSSQLGTPRPWVVDVSQPSVVDDAAIVSLGERFLGIDQLARSGDARSVLDAPIARRLRADLDR